MIFDSKPNQDAIEFKLLDSFQASFIEIYISGSSGSHLELFGQRAKKHTKKIVLSGGYNFTFDFLDFEQLQSVEIENRSILNKLNEFRINHSVLKHIRLLESDKEYKIDEKSIEDAIEIGCQCLEF